MSVQFTVHGIPAPQGSTRAYVVAGHAVTTNKGNRNSIAWRDSVARSSADQASLTGCITVPVHVTVAYRFPMPTSRRKSIQANGWAFRSIAPDIDKLLRSTLDGLQAGGLLRDDALVVSVTASKVEVRDEWTGAAITIRSVTP
jgi:Holliday junction resolvase RusA-like endonuclease